MQELGTLYERGKWLVGTFGFLSFFQVHRCKNPSYWDAIERSGGVMWKYPKDNTGHPASAINAHRPDGSETVLPFSLTPSEEFRHFLQSGAFQGAAPDQVAIWFWLIPAYRLLDPRRFNLYFADLYCLSSGYTMKRNHYVLLVVVEKGSELERNICTAGTAACWT